MEVFFHNLDSLGSPVFILIDGLFFIYEIISENKF